MQDSRRAFSMTILEKTRISLVQGSIGQWYEAKSRSDQIVINLVGALFISSVVLLGVWQPIQNNNSEQRSRYVNELTLTEWIALNKNRLRTLSNSSLRQADTSSAVARITNAANQNKVTLDRLQPESDGSVSISLQNQSFTKVLRWLVKLETQQGLTVLRLGIDKGSKTGEVSVQIRMSR